MKRVLPWALSLALASGIVGLTGLAGLAETAQPLPTPFPEARYQKMSEKSPFAVATAVAAATAAPTPGFASQLYVDGVAHVGNTEFVAIKSRDPDKPNAMFLEVGQPSVDGLKVERIRWSDEMGKSTVDVSKGGERATLIFDEAQIAKQGGGPAPAGPAPGMRMMPGQMRPMGFPAQNGQYPYRGYGPQFGQGPQGITLPPGSAGMRRRIRGLIPSGQ